MLAELQRVLEEQLGDRVGTFKFPAADGAVSRARQDARALLTSEQRREVFAATESFERWIIERDPEAYERVSTGGYAPQDTQVAVRVAEDAAIAMIVEGLDPLAAQTLRERFAAMTVETVDERIVAARPKFSWRNGHIQLAGVGVVVMVVGAIIASAAPTGGGATMIVGMAMVVYFIRTWAAAGYGRSNVSNVSQFKGGVMGRKRNQSL